MLYAGARWENLEKSLNAYIAAQLVSGAGLAVLFPAELPWDENPVRYVHVEPLIDLGQRRHTGLVRYGKGHERQVLLQCNCFENIQARRDNSGQAGAYTQAALTDLVCDAFGPQAVIPIRDYATSGNPVLRHFAVREVKRTTMPVPDGLPVEQRNVSITLAYEEAHT